MYTSREKGMQECGELNKCILQHAAALADMYLTCYLI